MTNNLITPPNWLIQSDNLTRTFEFEDYKTALEFVNKVANIAHNLNHHPDMILSWGKVVVTTTTHDEGNKITPKDIELSTQINKII